jgi:hypothetical protein
MDRVPFGLLLLTIALISLGGNRFPANNDAQCSPAEQQRCATSGVRQPLFDWPMRTSDSRAGAVPHHRTGRFAMVRWAEAVNLEHAGLIWPSIANRSDDLLT